MTEASADRPTRSDAGGFRLVETEVSDPRSVALCALLDAEMTARYAPRQQDDPPELREARTRALQVHPEQVVAVLLAVEASDVVAGPAVGHAMLRMLPGPDGPEWELKRLYVAERTRGRGVGRALVSEVVRRAREGGAARVVLQTGDPQHESLALYVSHGFTPIPVYEPYAATMPRSRCFELVL